MTISTEVKKAAQTIWDYHLLNQSLTKANCIIALGSNDLRVAEHAAALYLDGLADILVMSGNQGALTKDRFTKTEAEHFAEVAINLGVPKNAILLEKEATNTGENITLSKALLLENDIDANSIIFVQKPYMERRTLATVQAQWPEVECQISSPKISFANYPTPELPLELVINIMVGDFQRIIEYPKLGFSTEQPVTDEALEAFQILVEAGFDRHLITYSDSQKQ